MIPEHIKEKANEYAKANYGMFPGMSATARHCIEYGYLLANEERGEFLREIDQALYIGEDLNDKEVLEFYLNVVKEIRSRISEMLPIAPTEKK